MKRTVLVCLVVAMTGGCAPPNGNASLAPRPTASDLDIVVEMHEGRLEAARYTFSGFEPRIVVDVGDGWEGLHLLSEFWDVVRGEPDDLVSLHFSRPEVIFGRGTGVEAASAREALAAWRANDNITVDQPRDVTLDGRSGLEVDLINESAPLAHLWGAREGRFGVGEGITVRVIAIDLDDGLLLVGRQGNTASFGRVVAETEPMLASVRIGGQ